MEEHLGDGLLSSPPRKKWHASPTSRRHSAQRTLGEVFDSSSSDVQWSHDRHALQSSSNIGFSSFDGPMSTRLFSDSNGWVHSSSLSSSPVPMSSVPPDPLSSSSTQSPGVVQSSPASKTGRGADRFIRTRMDSDPIDLCSAFDYDDRLENSQMLKTHSSFNENKRQNDDWESPYEKLLSSEFLGITSPTKPVFNYGSSSSPSHSPMKNNPYSISPVTPSSSSLISPIRSTRRIQKAPYKVLDAPCLQDDFYLHLLDWSSSNVVAVGLGNSVFLWNACTSSVSKLTSMKDVHISSVSWNPDGNRIAVGSARGRIELWDAETMSILHAIPDHQVRVSTMSWSRSSPFTFASGSRDRSIRIWDIRAPSSSSPAETSSGDELTNDSSSVSCVKLFAAHKQEVCGLEFSYDDMQLASGGNDNLVLLWDPWRGGTDPIFSFTHHSAAIKALAWSPHTRGLLASGGGTSDRHIRFWNTHTGIMLDSIDTGSQVSNLHWSQNTNEIASTHGYSQNAVVIWSYPTMQRLATLTGHTWRVLYMSASPDGQSLVTGAGDETLRFWHVFPPKSKGPSRPSLVEPSPVSDIR